MACFLILSFSLSLYLMKRLTGTLIPFFGLDLSLSLSNFKLTTDIRVSLPLLADLIASLSISYLPIDVVVLPCCATFLSF